MEVGWAMPTKSFMCGIALPTVLRFFHKSDRIATWHEFFLSYLLVTVSEITVEQ
ncbi:hypothetical protein NUACC26_037400 [Scytonema sp. NUACC26]